MSTKQAIFVFVLGTTILILFAFSLILFLIHYKRKQQMHITEKLNMEHQYQTELLQTRLEVQEQSLKYFSEEIHDNIGQVLSLVKLQIYQLHQFCKDEAQEQLISKSTELLGKAIGDLRTISHTLNGNFIAQQGLVVTVQKELDYISSARSLKAQLHVIGDAHELSPEKELLIFRIIQEALANALKHAQPRHIDITLRYEDDRFAAIVKDDGEGFDEQNGSLKKGLGLNNMNSRAQMLNGNLSIRSAKNKGTELILTIANINS